MFLARAPFLRWQEPSRPLIGINTLQSFGWGYPYTNGGALLTVMPNTRLAAMKAQGFDFTRLCVDPETLLAADSASNTTTTVLDGRVDEIIAEAERRIAQGPERLIIDMHFHAATQSFAAGWSYTDVLDGVGGTKFTRLKFVSARLCSAIHAKARTTLPPSQVSYELFNEPPPTWTGISTATWILHQTALHAAVLAVMPLHTPIVAGNSFNAIDGTPDGTAGGLTSLTPQGFPENTGFAIHRYDSPVFTHQGVDSTIYQYMHGLTFPSADHPGGKAAAESAFTAATVSEGNHDGITASDALNSCVTQTGWFSSINQYFTTYGSKALLRTYENIATAHLTGNGKTVKHLFNTEFGVNFASTDDASDASTTAFVTATRENAEEANINCICIHELQGSNFGVQDTSSPWALKTPIAAGLFP